MIDAHQAKCVEGCLVNDESSTDEEMHSYFMDAFGMNPAEARFYVAQRDEALSGRAFKLKPYAPAKQLYKVSWDNGHSSGTFAEPFTSRRAAEQWAREWKRGMVQIEDSPRSRREAREAYQWEVIEVEAAAPDEEGELIREPWER